MDFTAFGKHYRLVEEVVRFAIGGTFLRKPFNRYGVSLPCVVVPNFDDVDLYRYCDLEGALIRGESDWIDTVIADDDCVPFDWLAEHETEEIAAYDKLHSWLWKQVEDDVRAVLPEDDACTAIGDWMAVIYQRMAIGKVDSIREKLFEVCLCGGYPCGWEGEYPSGRLAVYATSTLP